MAEKVAEKLKTQMEEIANQAAAEERGDASPPTGPLSMHWKAEPRRFDRRRPNAPLKPERAPLGREFHDHKAS